MCVYVLAFCLLLLLHGQRAKLTRVSLWQWTRCGGGGGHSRALNIAAVGKTHPSDLRRCDCTPGWGL